MQKNGLKAGNTSSTQIPKVTARTVQFVATDRRKVVGGRLFTSATLVPETLDCVQNFVLISIVQKNRELSQSVMTAFAFWDFAFNFKFRKIYFFDPVVCTL